MGFRFRWVFCQLEDLRKCRSQNEVLRALKTLPKDLNETYQRTLDGIDKEDHTLAMNALRWLSFSQRPLRVEELAEASIFNLNADTPFDVGDRFQDPRDILQVLSSLVSTDAKSLRVRRGRSERAETVKIAHFSVQEYLMSDRMPPHLAKTFQVQELTAHQTITECCLHYMNFCKIRTNYRTCPLFSYASQYWVDHAKLCNDTECACTDLACRFLSTESLVSNWFSIRHADWRYPGEKVPALSWAAFLGLTGVAKKLIHSGANVNALAGCSGTALQAACMTGHERVANLLLSMGADVNTQGGCYGNAFQAACYAGQLEIANLLLEKGADVNAQGGQYGNALQAACYAGHLKIANLLLEKGADINIQGGYYGNALQAACYAGHLKIANLLLERGADVNAQGGAHDDALRGASLAGRLTVVNLLLEKGADPNAQGGNYKNAIDAALQGIRQYRGNSTVVQTLLEHGATFDDEGNDAMIRASNAKDYLELAGLLVSQVKRTG
jgi:ankyrin repeat protein